MKNVSSTLIQYINRNQRRFDQNIYMMFVTRISFFLFIIKPVQPSVQWWSSKNKSKAKNTKNH